MSEFLRIQAHQVSSSLRALFDVGQPVAIRCFVVLDGSIRGRIRTDDLTRPAWWGAVQRVVLTTRALLASLGRLWMAILPAFVLLGLLAATIAASPADQPMLQPQPNSHDAPITTTIIASFASAIDSSTVSTRTIPIHGAQHGLMTATYTVDNTEIEIMPARPFFTGELVQGVVTTNTQAITGTALDVPAVWQFRTAVKAGSGTLFYRRSGLDSTWSLDINLGDLDGDGDLDIFLGHRDDASSVWFNDGTGHFSTNGIDLGTDFIIGVAMGDLDGDGDLDALLAGIQNDSFWRNDGHGTFSYGGEVFAGAYLIRKVVLGDLDGDGDLDAVTVTMCDPYDPNQECDYAGNRIFWNDGAGGLQLGTQSLGKGTYMDLSLGDLDNDGDLDAIAVRGRREGGDVWVNLGGGVYTSTQTIDGLFAHSVDLGDLDGDGDLDAFVAPQAGSTRAVWLNEGNGTLVGGQQLGSLGPARLGDFDGDGDLDAYSVNNSADKLWLNQGDATFVFSGQNLGLATSTGVALGDLDGDGDLDAVTSGTGIEPSLWINRGQLTRRFWLPLLVK